MLREQEMAGAGEPYLYGVIVLCAMYLPRRVPRIAAQQEQLQSDKYRLGLAWPAKLVQHTITALPTEQKWKCALCYFKREIF